ncbi:MAG TPA: hypothetical protein VN851_10635 [Thermoanaerobaculia bacterium]|nr:hypothetical protein [Thermoanaerobaculia bacterium]
MQKALGLALVGFFLATLSSAGLRPVPGDDRRTLLRVHSTLEEHPRPDAFLRNDIDRVITRGGGLVIISSSGLDDLRPEVQTGVGLGTAADLAALGEALAAAPVGGVIDCSANGIDRTGEIEITWYGRAGRRNRFTITLTEGEPTEGEPCPATTLAIFDAIATFEEAADGHLP